MRKPDFIVIGPGRSASTWLQKSLAAHPDIGLAAGIKETLFFNVFWNSGFDWYYDFFKDCNEKVVGEISNTYIFNPLVPARIASEVPEVKLVSILRNPVDRIKSVYLYRKRTGVITCSFEEALGYYPDIIWDNEYYRLLGEFLKYFSKDKLFIGLFDDIWSDPDSYLSNLYKWLGVDPEFRMPESGNKVNEALDARSVFLARLASDFAKKLRRRGLHGLLEKGKHNPLVRRVVYRKLRKEENFEVSAEIRSDIIRFLRDDILRLEELIGRDLSHWRSVP